jgi:hypothetical protein
VRAFAGMFSIGSVCMCDPVALVLVLRSVGSTVGDSLG